MYRQGKCILKAFFDNICKIIILHSIEIISGGNVAKTILCHIVDSPLAVLCPQHWEKVHRIFCIKQFMGYLVLFYLFI